MDARIDRNSGALSVSVVLREEADEWENICKRQPVHDICEGCEQAGLLRLAAKEIESLRSIIETYGDRNVISAMQAHLAGGSDGRSL